MNLTLVRGDYEIDVDVDLSLDALDPPDWMRVGFALGEPTALKLLDGDDDERAELLADPVVLRAVVWAKLAPMLETKFPHPDRPHGWRPTDLAVTAAGDRKPDDDLDLAALSEVVDG